MTRDDVEAYTGPEPTIEQLRNQFGWTVTRDDIEAYAGPEPTIEQLRKQFGWMWARCGVECSHNAALPLSWVAARIGADAPASALRKRLRCTHCGKRMAVLRAPSARIDGWAPLPMDRVPEGLRLELARQALRGLGIEQHG